MLLLRKIAVGFIIFCGAISLHAETTATTAQAETFAKTGLMQPINVILKSSKKNEALYGDFKSVFKPLLDTSYISTFILGAYKKQASDKDVQKFNDTFLEVNLQVIQKYLTQYRSWRLDYVDVKAGSSPNQFFAQLNFTDSSPGVPANQQQIIHTQWRLRYNTTTNKFYIADIVIEKLSLVLNYKIEYQNIMQQAIQDGKKPIPTLLIKLDELVVKLKKENSGAIPKEIDAKAKASS